MAAILSQYGIKIIIKAGDEIYGIAADGKKILIKSDDAKKIEAVYEAGQAKAYRPFTARYYKENLIIRTGKDLRETHHAHHIFPQKLQEYFYLAKGINVHDPSSARLVGKEESFGECIRLQCCLGAVVASPS